MECLLTLTSSNEAQTKNLAALLAGRCTAGDCILLNGDLGAGKTVFARGFIQALCGEEEVTSPTFTLMQPYTAKNGVAVSHFDLYRVKSAPELEQLGIDDALADGITLVEWPDIAQARFPGTSLSVAFTHENETSRGIMFTGDAGMWKKRLEGLQ
jgi:tRNA threonylcarbamoyl adenosine modification protein YjeE